MRVLPLLSSPFRVGLWLSAPAFSRNSSESVRFVLEGLTIAASQRSPVVLLRSLCHFTTGPDHSCSLLSILVSAGWLPAPAIARHLGPVSTVLIISDRSSGCRSALFCLVSIFPAHPYQGCLHIESRQIRYREFERLQTTASIQRQKTERLHLTCTN
jgi:hypothetical protein